MAISKVGLGWPLAERQYSTLAAWYSALKSSGAYEEAWCSGDLGASFVTIGTADFPLGALIRGDVVYNGANHNALAKLPRTLTIAASSGLVVVQDLWITHSVSGQASVNIGSSNRVKRLYVDHTADPGSNAAILMTSGNAIAEYCVVRGLLSTASKAIRPSSTGIVRNCIAIGTKYGLFSEWTNSKTERSYGVGASVASCNWQNGRPTANVTNASEDASGDVGFRDLPAQSNFVDYANGDYRIRASSPLHGAGIGAFFEEVTYVRDGVVTFAATLTGSVDSAKEGAAAIALQSDVAAIVESSKSGANSVSATSGMTVSLEAAKSASASTTLMAGVTASMAGHKVGVATIYMVVNAAAEIYAGNVYIGEGSLAISAVADVSLQGGKVGAHVLPFSAVATAYCSAAKQSSGIAFTNAVISSSLNSSKIALSTVQALITSEAVIQGNMIAAGTTNCLVSVAIALSGMSATTTPPVTIILMSTHSRHKHTMRTSSQRWHSLRTESRHSYNVTTSGGARV